MSAPSAAAPVNPDAAPTPSSAPVNGQAELLSAIRQTVADQLAPVQQAHKALQDQVNGLLQPTPQAQSAASKLFGAPGAAPGIRQGEDSMGSRGYSFSKAAALRQGAIDRNDCKVELQVHDLLSDVMRRQGFLPSEGNSLLVPLWTDAIPGLSEQQRADLRATVRQGVIGTDPNELHWISQRFQSVRQGLSQFDDTGLGVLLGPTMMGDLIELIRAKEVFSRAGSTQLALPPNGRLRFPRQTGATTAYWVGESATITSSEPTTGDVDMIAKKLATLVKLPNELLRFGNPSVEAFVRADMARVMALAADLAFLTGAGSTVRPKGLLSYSGIQSHTASTVGTDGNTFEVEDVNTMLGKLEEANHDVAGLGAAWVMRPLMRAAISNRRASVYNGTTTVAKGEFLFEMDRASQNTGFQGSLSGRPIVTSTQMPNNGTKGSGTGLTQILCGVFAHHLIGRVGVAEFATSTQGDTPFQADQTWLRVIQHLDAGVRYEDAFINCGSLIVA